jgi:hypothetical protein
MSDPNDPSRRLEAALERLGAEHVPPTGWEARVLAAIDRSEQANAEHAAHPSDPPIAGKPPSAPARDLARRQTPVHPPCRSDEARAGTPGAASPVQIDELARRRARWSSPQAVAALGAVAAVSLVVFGQLRRPREPTAPPLEVSVVSEFIGQARRGFQARVGDVEHVTVRGGQRYREIWVYREDQLIQRCPPDCHSDGDATVVAVKLSMPGAYVVLAVTSSAPLPVPQGSYDPDRAAAEQAGAKIEPRRFDVR